MLMRATMILSWLAGLAVVLVFGSVVRIFV